MDAFHRILAVLLSLILATAPASAAVSRFKLSLRGGGVFRIRTPNLTAAPALRQNIIPLITPRAFSAQREFFSAPLHGASPPKQALARSVHSHAQARGFAQTRSEDAVSPDPIIPSKIPISLRLVLGNLVAAQVGVEALSVAAPQIALKQFGSGTMALLSSASAIALGVGSLLGGQAVDRFGEARTYYATLAMRAAAVGTMGALFISHHLTAPALIGLFSLDYVLHFANYVALDALAPRILGGDAVRLNKFGLLRQVALDGAGFFAPIGAGLLIASRGYAPIFWGYPLLFAATAAVGWLTLRDRAAPQQPTSRPTEKKSLGTWREAVSEIRRDPVKRASVAGYALLSSVSVSIYFMIAPAYGAVAAVSSGGSAEQISSVMIGLFAGSGVIGAWMLSRLKSDLTRRMGTVMALAGLSLLSFWSLMGSTPIFRLTVFGVTAPIFAAQLMMIPFGILISIPLVGLMTLLQSRASERSQAKILGANRFAAMAGFFLLSNVLGSIFHILAPSSMATPSVFAGVGVLMTMLAVLAAWIGRSLHRAGSSTANGPVGARKGRVSGFFSR